MAYGEFRDLPRMKIKNSDKAFNFAKTPKYDGYQRCASMVYNCLIKSLLVLILQVVVLKIRIYEIKNYLKN